MLLRWLVVAAVLLRLWVVVQSDSVTLSLPEWTVALNARSRSSPPTRPRPRVNDETLLGWAQRVRGHHDNDSALPPPLRDPFIVVGAKTSVVHGFARRQTIRQTWASAPFLPPNVRVVFLGCESDLSGYTAAKQNLLREAIALERSVFGDVLTSELQQCEDSFARLADKVRAFFHWVASSHQSLSYAMVIDDDVYLRLDRLVDLLERKTTPRRRFFGGNSASSEYRGLAEPIRNPRDKYFIAKDAYPMRDLPPFLTGAHYILSGDLVRFVSKNFLRLRGLGAVDDVTVGLWLFMTLGVRPTFIDELHVLRSTKNCEDSFISLADLTTSATQHIHNNLLRGSRACHDFELVHWMKTVRGIIASSTETEGSAQLALFWDFQYLDDANRIQFLIRLAVGDQAFEFVFIPSNSRVSSGFCGRVSSLLQEKLYLTVDDEVCERHCQILASAVTDAVNESPALNALLALVRHNLGLQGIEEAQAKRVREFVATSAFVHGLEDSRTFVVVLSRRVQRVRVMIECLFVDVNPDKQVLVVYEDEVSIFTRVDVFIASRSTSDDDFKAARWGSASVIILDLVANLQYRNMAVDDHRIVTFSTIDNGAESTRSEVVVPPVSILFVNSIRYTPRDLLHARRKNEPAFKRVAVAAVGCVVDSGNFELNELTEHFRRSLHVDIIDVCQESLLGRFVVDESVALLKNYRFALIQNENPTTPFSGVDIQLTIAFLAGTVPIYSGQLGRVPKLFNQAAFVRCGDSMVAEACVGHVMEIQSSPEQYAQLLSASPIEDMKAFQNAFSWHPDTQGAAMSAGVQRLSSKLHQLLDM